MNADALRAHFVRETGVPLRNEWLLRILPLLQRGPGTHAQNLLEQFRSSDIKESVNGASLPSNLDGLHGTNVTRPVVVQVVTVEEIGISKLSQLEKLNEASSSEESQDYKIIRDVPVDENDWPSSEAGAGPVVVSKDALVGKHTCKLTLEDCNGLRAFAVELQSIDSIYVGMPLGCKLVLRNVPILRQVFVLGPASVVILGGKIAAWNTDFNARLKASLEQDLAYNSQ